MNKKGAMFGLDARIALAIFGALSVISGAALYSAIKTANSEQWRQYFEEYIKATEAYYLDNYSNIEVYNVPSNRLYTGDLVNNRDSLSTWKGPYLSYSKFDSDGIQDSMTIKFDDPTRVKIFLRKVTTWTEMNDQISDELCVIGDSNCAQWITLIPNLSSSADKLLVLFNDLDKLVDDSDGSLKGSVRFNTNSHGYIMYKGMPHKRTV